MTVYRYLITLFFIWINLSIAAPFITFAFAKGIRNFDLENALNGLVANTSPQGSRYFGGYAEKANPAAGFEYEKKGYISIENKLHGLHGEAVSSLCLYNSYHDWCIAQMALGLGRLDTYRRFKAGALNYQNVIWPEKQSAWVRMGNGAWLPNFSSSAKTLEQKGFCETSAAIATFFVPHDPVGFADLIGGRDKTAAMLDRQFQNVEEYNFYHQGSIHGDAVVDYANQDGTGMAHFFNRIGYP